MKKMMAMILVLSLATGLTATSVLGNMYGVLDTLDNYASTVQNTWQPNEFRSNVWNGYGSPEDPYDLGIYYSGIDDELKNVYSYVDGRYYPDNINGMSDTQITKFNPYVVVLSVSGYRVVCLQYEVIGKIYQVFDVKYTVCLPLEAFDGGGFLGDLSKILYVMSATSGNTYARVERNADFMGELRLWLQAPHGDSGIYVKETYKNADGVNVTVKEWMMQYDH